MAVPEASLRDRVATVYNKTGLVHNGERLQVLEHMQSKRFVRVRSPRGEEGWVQERYLADQETFDQFQRLAQEYAEAPAQGMAATQEQLKIHDAPGRKAGYLYLLSEKQKVELLQRRVVARNAPASVENRTGKQHDEDEDNDESDDDAEQEKSTRPAILEDWWLVRDQQKRIGWAYGRGLYLSIPYDVAQYAAGHRIVSDFLLDQVQDKGTKVGEYLLLLTEPKDGLPYDFNQIRVFTWNLRKHRYETAYREPNLFGVLPVTLGQQDFGKEGVLRTFTLQLQDAKGKKYKQLYKFDSPIVRKVATTGEEAAKQPGKKTKTTPARHHHT